MKRLLHSVAMLSIATLVLTSCMEEESTTTTAVNPYKLSPEEMTAVEDAGFSTEGAWKSEDGSLWIENDINLTVAQLKQMTPGDIVNEQYRTTNLVTTNGSRNISIYMEVETSGGGGGGGGNGNGNGNGNGGGPKGGSTAAAAFPSSYDLALTEVINRYNSENLEITFSRTTNQNAADIVLTRLNKRDERRGVLGSAGFPTASGDPYNEIKMSGVLQSSYNLTVNGIATIIAHEVGHCIGMRHTDYFDRSISCGGSPSNEGSAGVGAIHISGTTTGADLQGNGSWMLACTDGSNRPFTNDDQTALDVLY